MSSIKKRVESLENRTATLEHHIIIYNVAVSRDANGNLHEELGSETGLGWSLLRQPRETVEDFKNRCEREAAMAGLTWRK